MTWAGRSRSRSLALPVSARTRRTSPIGNALAITPRLMWSLTRMPAGRPAGIRAIVAARSRTSASMAQPCSYVNRIGPSPEDALEHEDVERAGVARPAAPVQGADRVGEVGLLGRVREAFGQQGLEAGAQELLGRG